MPQLPHGISGGIHFTLGDSQHSNYYGANPAINSQPSPQHALHDISSESLSSLSGDESEDYRIQPASTSGSSVVEQTAAAKAREKKLRDDPMANVLGPLYVDCRRCGTRIKLSAKSAYDTFHWRTHRERCLKKPEGAMKRHHKKASITASEASYSSAAQALSHTTPPSIASKPDVSDGSEVGLHAPSTPHPPTTTELDYLPSPELPSKVAQPIPEAHAIFEEYRLRSHPSRARSESPRPLEHWQEWNWSRLIAPEFVTYDPAQYEGKSLPTADSTSDAQAGRDVGTSSSLVTRSM